MTDRSTEITRRLKPCPFCGRKAMVYYTTSAPFLKSIGCKRPVYLVGCRGKDCILRMNKTEKTAVLLFWAEDPESIVERWNRRPE